MSLQFAIKNNIIIYVEVAVRKYEIRRCTYRRLQEKMQKRNVEEGTKFWG